MEAQINPALAILSNALDAVVMDLDLHGGGTWAPIRAPGDWSKYGDWECWENRVLREDAERNIVEFVPNGDWIAWDSKSGQIIGFPSRKAAEMLAVLRNENAATRVVHADDTVEESSIDYDSLATKVAVEVARLEGS